MLKPSLCDYNDGYILIIGRITITGEGVDDAAKRTDEIIKEVIFKNCTSFTKYISEMNNTQIDDAQEIDEVMSMYNLIEYSNNYWKISGSLWQCYRDKPSATLTDFAPFKSKVEITGKTPAARNTKDVKMAITLINLSNFWGTLEMSLINCEIALILTW